jgi:hypothetical protein
MITVYTRIAIENFCVFIKFFQKNHQKWFIRIYIWFFLHFFKKNFNYMQKSFYYTIPISIHEL